MGKQLPVAIVVWDDAHGDAHREVTIDDLPHRPSVMTTIGWLLRDDPSGVSLANEHAIDGDAECYRGHTFIPRGMIKSVTPFTLTKKRSSRREKDPLLDHADESADPASQHSQKV